MCIELLLTAQLCIPPRVLHFSAFIAHVMLLSSWCIHTVFVWVCVHLCHSYLYVYLFAAQGTVIIIANHGDRIDIPSGAMLENKIVSGNLRILDH